MKNISIKVNASLFIEMNSILSKLKKSKNQYLSEAIAVFNNHHLRIFLKKQLKKESELVSLESMKILAEFDGTMVS